MSSPKIMKHHNNPHQPVLLNAVLELLRPSKGDRYLDLTAGFGGHAQAVLDATSNPRQAYLVDRDKEAVSFLNKEFPNSNILHTDYVSALSTIRDKGQKVDLILMDIGVSSLQLDQSERGFSFRFSAPLDMRMDQRQQLTAHEVVNDFSREELAEIISKYGEEPHAQIIASAIVENRSIETTQELSELISKTIGRRGKINPATRTFQAIRMVVNDELGQLEQALDLILDVLDDEGRLAVISFHSLEDRIVKRFFKEQSESGYESTLKVLTKRPISGNKDVNNPRARSAKLRAALKIKTQNQKKGDLDADSG